MSQSTVEKNTSLALALNAETNRSRPAGRLPRAGLLLVAAAGTLMAACTPPTHSIIVGSIPDDYRTNHPIVIGESEKVLDLPVGANSYGMTEAQRIRLEGFLSDYNSRSAPFVSILVPAGSANEAAAEHAAGDFAAFMRRNGISRNHILVQSYQSPVPEASAPIRVSYTVTRASTNKCGRWPKDILDNAENKHYADFGCSSQNNLAAQVANPTDLLGPRRSTSIDAENRGVAIDKYKAKSISDDFSSKREIDY